MSEEKVWEAWDKIVEAKKKAKEAKKALGDWEAKKKALEAAENTVSWNTKDEAEEKAWGIYVKVRNNAKKKMVKALEDWDKITEGKR